MKIEILYFDGCPNHSATLALVRQVVADLELFPEIEVTEVHSEAEVRRLRFLGSPTVRVDGRDIEPAARSKTDYAFGCRTYGGSGVPPRDLLESALSGKLTT